MAHQKSNAALAVLALSVIMFATLCSTQTAAASNTIATMGDIAVTNKDNSPFTSYHFPLFTPGTPETQSKTFYIENIGDRHVNIKWKITSSTIQWNNDGKEYCHDENGIDKYTITIQHKPHGNFKPEKQQINLKPQEKTKLTLELAYTGKSNTPETFTLTITFTATAHTNRK